MLNDIKFSKIKAYCYTCHTDCPIKFLGNGKRVCEVCNSPMISPDEKLLEKARSMGRGKKSEIKRSKQTVPDQISETTIKKYIQEQKRS